MKSLLCVLVVLTCLGFSQTIPRCLVVRGSHSTRVYSQGRVEYKRNYSNKDLKRLSDDGVTVVEFERKHRYPKTAWHYTGRYGLDFVPMDICRNLTLESPKVAPIPLAFPNTPMSGKPIPSGLDPNCMKAEADKAGMLQCTQWRTANR